MKGNFGLIAVFAIILAAVNLEAAPKQAAPTVCPSEDSLEETVLLAHESDCSKFYVCFLGEKILKECPYSNSRGDRLHFNPLLQVCDYPSEVGCKFQPVLTTYVDVPLTNQQTSQLTTPRNIPSSISSTNPSNSIRYEEHECTRSLYYENINGKKILKQCSNDRYWNQDLQACYIDEKKESTHQGISRTKLTLPFNLTCTEGELRKHECQCQLYYECCNGDLVRTHCKDDNHWDDVNKKCTRPGKAKCTYVKCNGGYYKPDEVDCDKYYRCEGTIYVPHRCASGLNWDRENEVCSKTADCPINHCDQGPNKPHETECNKYYVCEHNHYVEKTCPSGLHWDRKNNICTTPDKANCPYCIVGSTKPHEVYCEWYYTCLNGTNIKQECPRGEQWDRNNNRCRRIEEANCPLNHCDQGYYKPHENDCDKYYVCELSNYVRQTCPSRLYWDRKHNICTTPDKANCPYCIEGSNKPHELYCEWYYTCKNGHFINQECPTGEQWDRNNNRCRRIEEANCPLNHCDQGYYKPHERECDKYYVCYHNNYVQQTCPSRLYWDRKNNICTTPDKANCPYCIEGSNKPHELYCEWYYTCKNGGYIKQECPRGEQWDRNNNRCRRIEEANCPQNHCVQGYYKPHEKDCDKYYVCELSNYVQHTCPSGLYWDRNHNVCTTPDRANCPYCIEGSTKPHECYCELFYRCKNGHFINQECPTGEQWDRNNNLCRRIEEANCPLNHCDQGYYKPHERECDKYYVCYHNNYVQQTCPSGLYWDRKNNICTTPDKANCPYCIEGSNKPHELYCEWYYTCKNGHFINQECPTGEQWDRNNNRCRRIEEANCPLNHCDQGYYKPHERECDKYYVCYHNNYVQQTCPSGLHWDRKNYICTTPEKANCRICIDGSTKPHECQCEWSYICISGAWNLQKCLRGLHWDRNNYRCSKPEEAHCPSYKCTEGSFKPYENVCNMYYECENNNYVPRTCKSGLHWNQARNICTSVEEANCPYLPKLRCIEDSTLYHECKCELYYQCVKGELVQKKCTDGKEWDRDNNKCEIAEVAKCPYHSSTCKEGPFKSHEIECNKYYACENGTYVQKTCPSGLFWDRKHNICSVPELVDCRVCIENSTAPHECNCNLYYLCRNGKFTKQKCDGKLEWDRVNHQCRNPSEANCHKNFACVEGSYNNVTKVCDPGLYWNQEYNICMKPLDALYSTALITTCAEGLFKPHEKDCDKVYMCINHMYIQLKCSSGFYWNQERLYCTARSEANCRRRPCVEGSTQADKLYCEFYYKCKGSRLIRHKCPNGLHWDQKHNICTTPDKANCPSIQSSQARQEHPFGIKT